MAEWFETWFGEEYIALYAHRDDEDATRLVDLLRRLLPWQPGWRVLDVGCGPGRHARALDRLGSSPIGVDLSLTLLRLAQRVTDAPLVRADMRALPMRSGAFDLTVNLFTSFGYFADDAEHALALREMIGTLRPGGWFVLDYLDARAVVEGLVPEERQVLNGEPVTITREVTGENRFVVKTFHLADGRTFVERVRLLDAAELERMISTAGAEVRHRFADYQGTPLSDAVRENGTGARTLLIGERCRC